MIFSFFRTIFLVLHSTKTKNSVIYALKLESITTSLISGTQQAMIFALSKIIVRAIPRCYPCSVCKIALASIKITKFSYIRPNNCIEASGLAKKPIDLYTNFLFTGSTILLVGRSANKLHTIASVGKGFSTITAIL